MTQNPWTFFITSTSFALAVFRTFEQKAFSMNLVIISTDFQKVFNFDPLSSSFKLLLRNRLFSYECWFFFPTDFFKVCILIPYSISSLNVRPPRFYDRPHLPLGIIYHYKLSVPTHSEYSLDPTSTPCNAYIVQFHRNLFA